MILIFICLLVIAGALGACAVAVRRWGRAPAPAGPARVELCCRCNAPIINDAIHEIIAVPTDDRAIGVEMGGTFVAADFCAACCLGPDAGCRHPDHATMKA